ncbi:MAG: L-threonylcarbamoyladenylate synthase [Candidatus Omnitrophota bacterium]
MMLNEAKIYKLSDLSLTMLELEELKNLLEQGQLIVFPTETVYGVACFYDSEEGKRKIFEIKKREEKKKLPVMVNDIAVIKEYFKCESSFLVEEVTRKFMPGPVTVILKCADGQNIGFRIPDDRFVLDLISFCGRPLAVTSANLSGEEAAVDFKEAYDIFHDKVSAIVDGGKRGSGLSSTVIDLTGQNMLVLREGAYDKDLIETALANPKKILFVCTGNTCRSVMAEAILEKMIEDKKIEGMKVASAGISAFDGMPPTRETAYELEQAGVRTELGVSKSVNEYMLQEADLILVMERRHLDYIISSDSELKRKTFLFLEFAFGIKDGSVLDPIGGGMHEYHKIFSLIEEGIQKIIKKIL